MMKKNVVDRRYSLRRRIGQTVSLIFEEKWKIYLKIIKPLRSLRLCGE